MLSGKRFGLGPVKTPAAMKSIAMFKTPAAKTPAAGSRRALGDITNKGEQTPLLTQKPALKTQTKVFVEELDDIEYAPPFAPYPTVVPEVDIDVMKIAALVDNFYLPPSRLPEPDDTDAPLFTDFCDDDFDIQVRPSSDAE